MCLESSYINVLAVSVEGMIHSPMGGCPYICNLVVLITGLGIRSWQTSVGALGALAVSSGAQPGFPANYSRSPGANFGSVSGTDAPEGAIELPFARKPPQSGVFIVIPYQPPHFSHVQECVIVVGAEP